MFSLIFLISLIIFYYILPHQFWGKVQLNRSAWRHFLVNESIVNTLLKESLIFLETSKRPWIESACSENSLLIVHHFLAAGESNRKLRPTNNNQTFRHLMFVNVQECSLCVENITNIEDNEVMPCFLWEYLSYTD